MAYFNVSLDLLVPVLLEIEAEDEDEALEKLYEMDPGKLLKRANTESSGLVIYEESVTVEPGR